ncbi:MAG TPA: hypothetical protein VHD32_06060 [Candidatus Didemnitutus sp.]|nr:hypothetical protein [Candidatus Didemnitutus sp.]
MKKPLIALLVAAITAAGIAVYAWMNLQQPMNEVLASDSRNAGIEVRVSYDGWLPGSAIVYDLTAVAGSNSPADVFRVFLQYAAKKKDERFERIYLSHRGVRKFYVEGFYFRTLGEEFGSQNAVYTIRTFPEHVMTPSGLPAFSKWEGGILGVSMRQMDDFSNFTKQWFLSDL